MLYNRKQALSQYERGLRYPDIAILKALCRYS